MRASNPCKTSLPMAAVAAIGFVTGSMSFHAMATEPEAHEQPNRNYVIKQEVHGKPSITLREKFTIPVADAASGVAWSPDGSILGVYSQTVFATYSNSGRYLNEFRSNDGFKDLLLTTAFLDGAKEVVFPVRSLSERNAGVDIRDVASGKIVTTVRGRSAAWMFSVSPDQKRLAFASLLDDSVITYETQTWKLLSTIKLNYPHTGAFSLAFFPDNTRLVVGMGGEDDTRVDVADSTSGQIINDFQLHPVKPNQFVHVDAVAVSPDGKFLLVCVDDGTVRILHVEDGKQKASLNDLTGGFREGQAIWDPKGRFVAFIDVNGLVVWQPETAGESYIKFRFSSPPKTFVDFVIGKSIRMDTSDVFGLTIAITKDGKSLAVTHGDSVTVFTIE